MNPLKLHKGERIKGTKAAERLLVPFASQPAKKDSSPAQEPPKSVLVYPLKAIWLDFPQQRCEYRFKALFAVPKKRIRKAVGRVRVRRMMREAFRLYKAEIPDTAPNAIRHEIAFRYVADAPVDFALIAKAMKICLEIVIGERPLKRPALRNPKKTKDNDNARN